MADKPDELLEAGALAIAYATRAAGKVAEAVAELGTGEESTRAALDQAFLALLDVADALGGFRELVLKHFSAPEGLN